MKQKKELVVLAVLLAIAGIVWFFYFERGKSFLAADPSFEIKNTRLLSVENPQLHKDRIDRARRTEYKSTGRNIFSFIATPQPSTMAHKGNADPGPVWQGPRPPLPDPPPALPANLKFFGYGTVPNGNTRRAFFTDGQDVYVVAEGEVLLNRFRILRVGNASLEFEEVSSGRRGRTELVVETSGPSA